MMNWPFTFPNANALLDNMQKQHIAGIHRIERMAIAWLPVGLTSRSFGVPSNPHRLTTDEIIKIEKLTRLFDMGSSVKISDRMEKLLGVGKRLKRGEIL